MNVKDIYSKAPIQFDEYDPDPCENFPKLAKYLENFRVAELPPYRISPDFIVTLFPSLLIFGKNKVSTQQGG